jgi:hypothetical protein
MILGGTTIARSLTHRAGTGASAQAARLRRSESIVCWKRTR